VPLYSGWLASFILQVREAGVEAADQRVDDLAMAFEKQKPYLISRWRWPERVRT
jgi:glucosylglycerate synthase